jgi:hypothetical protein
MISNNQIIKDVVLSQDTTVIRAKCPICLSKISSKHCKVFKSPSSLWHHLKREHTDYDFTSFENSVEKMNIILENLSIAKNWGMIS